MTRQPLGWFTSFAAVLLWPAVASAWLGAAWAYRRPLEVTWDAERAGGDELAAADFYVNGHARPDGADLRVTTADDRPVPMRLLTVGPGDRVRLAFAPSRGVRQYWVYFGHPNPPPRPPGSGDVKPTAGLLMEMRQWPGGGADSFQQLEGAWSRNSAEIGRIALDRALLGFNPFGEQQTTISRIEATFRVPADGEYTFALSADDRAALSIDGEPLLFAAEAPADARINATRRLSKGKHALLVYHANLGGDARLTVAWRPAGFKGFQAIADDAVGKVLRARAGALEAVGGAPLADFAVEYAGECFFADGYSHRYTLTARPPKGAAAPASYAWDFGDGQTGAGESTNHVFLADGVYAVKLTTRTGGRVDSQTVRVAVSRDYEHLDRPPQDAVALHAGMAAFYDPAKLPPAWLPRLALLDLRTEQLVPMVTASKLLASLSTHPDPPTAVAALREVATDLTKRGQADLAAKLWEQARPTSDLQPAATQARAELLLWRAGDYAAAAKLLEPLAADGDARTKRLYAQALLLNQHVDEATRILESLPATGEPPRRAAANGASARTVEYYVRQRDPEAGDAEWEAWQSRDPADFLQGYSVLLKCQLLDVAKAPESAARLAEAFARAVPGSSYGPRLLDLASKLVERSDPARSAALRVLVKERYPEASSDR